MTQVAQQIVARPANGGLATVTFSGLLPGALTFQASAYPSADGTGVAEASGSVGVTVLSGKTVTNTLTMGSTIDHVAVTPSPVTLSGGGSALVTGTAYDASGSVVLTTPSLWTWGTNAANIVTVAPSGDTATVQQGDGTGSATVTATETESGKSAVVTVSAPTPRTSPITLSVTWPARSRAVSATSSALSAIIVLSGANPAGGDFRFVIDRDTTQVGGYSSSYTSASSALIGPRQVTATFYAGADGNGSVVATASGAVTIQRDGSGIDGLTTVGTIASVALSLGSTSLYAGTATPITVTPMDNAGNMVAVTPGSVFYTFTSGQGSVVQIDGTGTVLQALNPGTAHFSASVDGVGSLGADVTVLPLGTVQIGIQ